MHTSISRPSQRRHDGRGRQRLPPHPLGSGQLQLQRRAVTRSIRCTTLPPLPSGQPTAWTTWAAHTDNVVYDVETGHFEPPDAPSDLNPSDDPPCFSGPQLPGCLGSDYDFDGPYGLGDWPNGSSNTPTPNYVSSPRSGSGLFGVYPLTRFETDLPRIEEANNGATLACDHHTGAGCSNPPPARSIPGTTCCDRHPARAAAWALTDDVRGQLSNLGGERAAWGPLERTDYGFDTRIHNYARTILNPCP